MTRPAFLRWYLWSLATFAVMGVAGVMGFFKLLLASDLTYLGFVVIGLYVATTGLMFFKVKRQDTDYGFVLHIAKVMSYVGILGTFVGLSVAFQAMANLPPDGSIPPTLKVEFLKGVLTKFYTSIVGIIGFIFLEMQVRVLGDAQD